jgi:iron complex transport system permease protein
MSDEAQGRQPRRDLYATINLALVIGLCFVAFASLLIGASHISITNAMRGLLGLDEASAIIVREIRLPRMLLAAGVGAVLGLSGAAIQGLTRNPLAEPAVLGTPQAAALGAVAVLYTGAASANSVMLAIAAISTAGCSMALILLLIRARQNILTLLLTGLGIGSLTGAAMSFIISVSPNPYAVMEIVFWLMGSFEDRSMIHVAIAFPFMIIAVLLLYSCHSGYTALTLGEDTAQSLGVDVTRISMLTAAGISIGIGSAVAVSGAIGFVGLIAPHLVRPWCGGDPGRALLPSALCGALLTALADVLVRLIPSTGEVRIGVLTAMIGAPWFIWLVVTRRGLFGSSNP